MNVFLISVQDTMEHPNDDGLTVASAMNELTSIGSAAKQHLQNTIDVANL